MDQTSELPIMGPLNERVTIVFSDITTNESHVEKQGTVPNKPNMDGVLDISEIIASDFTLPKDHIQVPCVLGEMTNPFHRIRRGADTMKKFFPLDDSPESSALEPILNLARNQLAPEIQEEVMKFFDYDQVCWLVEKNERFARLLAKNRYNIDSYNKTIFPTVNELLPFIQREAAKEIRFRHNEDLWILSRGEAKRYKIKEGTYHWYQKEWLVDIIFEKEKLWMSKLVKVLALKDSSEVEIDSRYTSPLFKHESKNRYFIHILKDVLPCEWGKATGFKTLIFKNPVKFFNSHIHSQWVYKNSALAFLSEDNEVLGYMVQEGSVRFRLPKEHTQQSHLIGMHFFSDELHDILSRKCFVSLADHPSTSTHTLSHLLVSSRQGVDRRP